MADENNEDDSWLYGSANNENTENQETDSSQIDGKKVTETTANDDIAEITQNNESAEVETFIGMTLCLFSSRCLIDFELFFVGSSRWK